MEPTFTVTIDPETEHISVQQNRVVSGMGGIAMITTLDRFAKEHNRWDCCITG